jgi:metal-sulfur cluster biosynthetic enzyme
MKTLRFVGCMRKEIAERLRAVIDPEIGINIVDLGLIYDISAKEDTVRVALTMTTPACPLSSHITSRIEQELSLLPGVGEVETELVWEPRWSPAMMDAEAREILRG